MKKIYNYIDTMHYHAYSNGYFEFNDEYRELINEYIYKYIPDNSKYNGIEFLHNIIYLLDNNNNRIYLKVDERFNNYLYSVKVVYRDLHSVPKVMKYIKKFI